MHPRDPIRVFVTHAFADNDDYGRVFEYLESARNFYYRNCSAPEVSPGTTEEARREALRLQLQPAEAVIALGSVLAAEPSLLLFELHFAKASHKPVLMLPAFGSEIVKPKVLDGLVDEFVGWDERALADALRRQARHEETVRWDTIEFKLD